MKPQKIEGENHPLLNDMEEQEKNWEDRPVPEPIEEEKEEEEEEDES